MSYYDPQSWQIPQRDAIWDQQPPSRSDTSSSMQRGDAGAFSSQIEDVERAIDNLAKSGKLFVPNNRRESMPMVGMAPPFNDYQAPRVTGIGGRHHSVDYDQGRSHSGSGLQMFYANQRHQSRPNDAEHMAQAKRRMAAQRERELRNYHQEQQFNRNVSTQGKPDQSFSPTSTNEEDRHELIARQRRALYGKDGGALLEGGAYGDDNHTPRPSHPTSGTSSAAGGRGSSPRTYDPFAMGQPQPSSNVGEGNGQLGSNEPSSQTGQKGPSPNPQQQRSRTESTSSPASNPAGQNFSVFDAAQQSSRTSTSSPGGSPPRSGKTSAPGVAPIGTRPTQAVNPAFSKRSGTPSASPLAYSFGANENLSATSNNNERSTSSNSNPPSATTKDSNIGAWGAPGSGPWGSSNNSSSKPLGVQASVWG